MNNLGNTDHNPGDGDIGLITLNAPIGNQTGHFGLGYNDDDSFAGETLNTIGYPGAGNQNPYSGDNGYNQWSQSGAIGGTTNFLQLSLGAPFSAFYYSLSGIITEGGQSGSPLFNNQGIIYGVIESSNSTTGTGYAERITSYVYGATEAAIQADESGSGGSDSRQAEAVISNPVLLKTQTTLLTLASGPVSYGQPVTFTAYVSAPDAPTPKTGTVKFYDNGTTLLDSVTLNATSSTQASASFSTYTLGIGSHTITAVYSGGGDFQGSTSGADTVTVTAATSYTTLTASAAAATYGQPLTFAAVVSGAGSGAPIGTVTFYDGAKGLGAVTLTQSSVGTSYAKLSTSALSVGPHTITAVYSGDSYLQHSTSGAVTETVLPTPPAAIVKANGELDLFNQNSGTFTPISPAGTIKAVSTVVNLNGQTVVFAITTGGSGPQYNNTLWEYNSSGWTQLTGQAYIFQQISAATNASGEATVFGVTTNQALYEDSQFNGITPINPSGLDKGLTLLSPAGTIESASAVTDHSGIVTLTRSSPRPTISG